MNILKTEWKIKREFATEEFHLYNQEWWKLTFVFMWFLFSAIVVNAQLPEKAEDISPILNGEMLPEVELLSPGGEKHQFSELLKEKPSVILFYRGGWCPFCNSHLAEIQQVQNEVLNLGYQIIAISPDSPEDLLATDEKQNLAYRLFSDGNGELIKKMGIAFKAPERYSAMLFENSNGLNDGFLPVPSVFVADTSGKIVFEYINPDYRTRLSGKLLLAVLENIEPEQ